ncbi:MAG: AMP-binding protein [Bacteroidales bacterium]|nr:AMP-binding protein [Bacteroidales bacterium]
MDKNYHGLLLNNKIFPKDGLLDLCDSKLDEPGTPNWEMNVFSFIKEWLNDKNYIVQQSSGSTGKPKEIKLFKESMVGSAKITCSYFDIRFGQTALLCLPIEYIAGKMMIVRAFVGGLNLLLTEPSSMPELSGFGKIDFCAMVPLQVYNSLNSIETLRRIDKLIIGGGEIRDELEVMLRDLPNNVFATYGMAETCSHVAIRRLSGSTYERFYNAVPGVKFNTDQRNCLVVETPFLKEKVVTNDVVDLINGQSFRWIGRYDNLINSGGIKIVPEEVEAVVSKITGLDCAVLGIDDPKLGQKLVLVLERGGSEITSGEIEALLITELPKHLQPKKVILLDELPRNHSFKVNRKELASQLKD